MGLRGPHKKPTAVSKYEGRKYQAQNESEPRPTVGEPDMPDWLPVGARKVWHELVDALIEVPGLLTVVDGGQLANLAVIRDRKIRCVDAFEQLVAEAALQIAEDAKVKGRKLTAKQIQAKAFMHALARQDNRGVDHKRPIGPAFKQLVDLDMKLSREFGMTPSARSTMHVTGGKPAADPLEDTLLGDDPPEVRPRSALVQ